MDYLTELDSELGDGDHGVSLDRGFSEVRRELSGFGGSDVGTVLELAGASLVSSMGGAAGPIFGMAFSSAGHEVKGRSSVGNAITSTKRQWISAGNATNSDSRCRR